ncbi:MAG: hypothetical protein JNL18_23020 [Planctomycetaceae bacterium]|nr:hypothetical protein [Planctomycetaceae bacterium]
MKRPPSQIARLITLTCLIGCQDPALEIAREAANRQAQQNDQIAQTTREAASAAKRLIEEEAKSRQALLAAQQGLQQEQSKLADAWNDVEAERQRIAAARRGDSLLVASLKTLGAIIAALMALALSWLVLERLHDAGDEELVTVELLLAAVSDDEASMFPSEPSPAEQPLRLPEPQD